MVMRHGLADLNKGPGFNSHDTKAVVQGGLGALLIHGTTRFRKATAPSNASTAAYDQVRVPSTWTPPAMRSRYA